MMGQAEHKTDEIMLFEHPVLPDLWTYEESVKRMQRLIYKWKNMTRDVANELWVAREKLRVSPQDSGAMSHEVCANVQTWGRYCQDIGIVQQTANRWLNKWFPESLTFLKHGE